MTDPATTCAAEIVAACRAEIIALHQVFERALGAPGEDASARFEAAFAPGFAMVMPNGRRLARAEVLAFLRDARGVRGEGFRIAIEDVAVLHAAPPLMLMHYVERQWVGGAETARRAAALFDLSGPTPRWLFVQETWITLPPA
ncbi:DUF4440 domain-containing protein [Falsiroseomonas oryziterrae]|uniref:DUF4440 domain-containing protein n=1 Tax=Falsiroseomonas oryziterrae TaxID=2911368 RepID=UPI001F3797FF|nr:DUF4440 domain-containing protein [Roseomonas sp. NPKOSM-4]